MRRAVRPLKRIYSSYSRIAVHHLRNVLEASGISAVVRNELLSSAMGELPPAECQTELWVSAAEAEQALSVLNGIPEGESWTCRLCAEQSEPQFTQCWRCGADRSA